MKPAVLNLELFKGDDYDLTLSFVDQADAPVDLSTRTFVAPVRRFADSRDATLFTVDAADAASGVLRLSLHSTATGLLVSGEWLLQETIGGKRHTILGGRLAVVQEARGVAEGATATVRLAPDVVRIVTTGTTGPAGPSGAGNGPAGGVLAGTYPNPGFAVDMATQVELDTGLATKQDHDTDLDTIAAISSATAGVLVTDGAGWIRKTYAQLKTALGLTKADVGLGNVDNTSDVNKPVSTAQAAALSAKADLVGGVVPTAQIPSIAITDVFTAANQAAMLALTAQRGDMALRTDTGHRFVLSTDSPGTLADWVDLGAATDAVASVNGQTGIVVLGKADIGLANVDNTSDANKPVSSAQQAALDAKLVAGSTATYANLAALPTASAHTNEIVKTLDGGVYESTGSAWVQLVPPSGTYATPYEAQILGKGEPGLLCVIADDGLTAHVTDLWPLAQQFGVKLGLAIYTDAIGTAGHASWADLTAMYNDGHQIITHGKTHGNLTGETTANRLLEYAAQATIETNVGAPVGSLDTWAYPFSDSGRNSTTDAEMYLRFSRVLTGRKSRYLTRFEQRGSHIIGRFGGWTNSNHQQFLEAVRLLAAGPQVLIVYLHDIGSAADKIALASVTELFQLAADLGVAIVRVDQAFPIHRPIVDAGFEAGTMDHWSETSSDATVTAASVLDTPSSGLPGVRSLQLVTTNDAQWREVRSAHLTPAKGGTVHQVSGAVRFPTKSSGAGGAAFGIEEYDIFGNVVATTYIPALTAASASWAKVSKTDIVLNTNTVTVAPVCRLGECTGTAYFDHLHLGPTSEGVLG